MFYLKINCIMKPSLKLSILAAIVTVIFFAINAQAQTIPAKAWRLGLGIETGVPTNDASFGTSFTLGGTARLQYGLSNSFALTLTTGGYHYFPKKNPVTGIRYQSYGEIPIKGGIKAFFAPNIYFGAEAGVAWEKLETGWGPSRLDLSPALGYANDHWDFAVHYESFSRKQDHLGMVNLRVAYGFGL
jgi:hypothetical protein